MFVLGPLIHNDGLFKENLHHDNKPSEIESIFRPLFVPFDDKCCLSQQKIRTYAQCNKIGLIRWHQSLFAELVSENSQKI